MKSAKAAYVLGSEAGVVRNGAYAFEIMPMVVLGVETSRGYRPIKPGVFFTPVKINEFAV